jgi:hypothetical protein
MKLNGIKKKGFDPLQIYSLECNLKFTSWLFFIDLILWNLCNNFHNYSNFHLFAMLL